MGHLLRKWIQEGTAGRRSKRPPSTPSPPLPSPPPRATADRQASRLSWTQIDGTNEKVSTDRLALKAVPGLGVLSLAPPPSFPPRPSHADLAVCRQPFSFHSLHIKDLAYFLPPSILTRLGITTIASHLKEMERKKTFKDAKVCGRGRKRKWI
ncbi:uncharacterized protein BO66DRAFT_48954 [Aspergillus aculeatinus CBS 121060]|uniref:Uncharacterized protein n=1 Tax=Aspergillus aculeatinus CBS 121060 TaxID=1448322 RepID=A0ACD1HEG3_9EURO|nr:hypothetical protein BO66DRAFT_48954 [Aspergillus aculeatinus CBS 121060]RAH71800.1 hypothetical protein BO66DRAFT_48954 [Aspergillus aculeatinus CBS 121060]